MGTIGIISIIINAIVLSVFLGWTICNIIDKMSDLNCQVRHLDMKVQSLLSLNVRTLINAESKFSDFSYMDGDDNFDEAYDMIFTHFRDRGKEIFEGLKKEALMDKIPFKKENMSVVRLFLADDFFGLDYAAFFDMYQEKGIDSVEEMFHKTIETGPEEYLENLNTFLDYLRRDPKYNNPEIIVGEAIAQVYYILQSES